MSRSTGWRTTAKCSSTKTNRWGGSGGGLQPLTEQAFVRIMTEPENALTKQYQALVAAEGAELEFTAAGIAEVARVAFMANDRMENIGARRLATVLAGRGEGVGFRVSG